MNGKMIILRLYMESSDHVYNYTGKISKTIVLTEAPELEYLFKPTKGFFKQLRVSPPLSSGKAVVPVYTARYANGRLTYELKPAMLRGEYIVEVGIPSDVANTLYNRLKQIKGVKTRLKFENTIITYLVEDIRVEEPKIQLSGTIITIRTPSPALLPNPLVPNQHVRRFTTSPGALLWVPRMISEGTFTSTGEDARRYYLELEECLTEHYSTRYKTVFVNYDNNREPAIIARARYMLTPRDSEKRTRCIELLKRTLTVARIYGIGASRANGFGTITIENHNASTGN